MGGAYDEYHFGESPYLPGTLLDEVVNSRSERAPALGPVGRPRDVGRCPRHGGRERERPGTEGFDPAHEVRDLKGVLKGLETLTP